jgi:uncharacterized DUF497 family protein
MPELAVLHVVAPLGNLFYRLAEDYRLHRKLLVSCSLWWLATYDTPHILDHWLTLGRTKDSGLLVVVHTFVEYHHNHVAMVRIISARPATRHEQKQYEVGA